jgi:hypothetical protein
LAEQRTENPRVGGSIPPLAISRLIRGMNHSAEPDRLLVIAKLITLGRASARSEQIQRSSRALIHEREGGERLQVIVRMTILEGEENSMYYLEDDSAAKIAKLEKEIMQLREQLRAAQEAEEEQDQYIATLIRGS